MSQSHVLRRAIERSSYAQITKFLSLELLLWAEVVGVTALLLAAVHCACMQPRIAFATDHLLAIVLAGENCQGWLDDATTQTQDQVESGLLLDVVVGKGATIFQLFAGENETLLIRGDTFFILNLRLDVVDGVGGLNIKGNGLAGERFHKDLHGWHGLTPPLPIVRLKLLCTKN